MVHALAIEVVIVGHGGCILLLLLELEHLISIDVCLEVVVAWHQSPRDLQAGQSVYEGLIVLLPEVLLIAIPSLPADNVTSDRDKVRLLFANEGPDHLESLVVEGGLADFSEMHVGQLHDLEVVVLIHTQVQTI